MLKLNDFFANDSGLDNVLFVQDNKKYTKREVCCLIKKYITLARQMDGKDCILSTSDNLLFVVGFFALLHAEKNIILTSNTRKSTLEALGTNNVFSDDTLNFDLLENPEEEIVPFDEKKANIFFFTSGSTGTPKKILKTFNSLYQELFAVDGVLGAKVKTATTTLSTVTFFHLYGITFSFLYSLAKGFLIDTKLIETPEDLNYRLSLYENVFLVTSPAFMDRLARYKDAYHYPHKPYLMTSSGGPLSAKGAKAAKDLFDIYPNEIFGSTETGVVGTRQQLISENWALFPLVAAHSGKDGRLVVTSTFMDDEEFIMGDEVEFVSGDAFVLKGRLDRMIKLEEKRVSLPEVEKNLSVHPHIEKVHCLEVLNKNGRKTIGACVSLSKNGRTLLSTHGRKPVIGELKTHLNDLIDKIAVPAKWRFVDEIPMNSQSKIKLEEIKDLFQSNISEPVVLDKKVGTGFAEYKLVFLEEAAYFQGHFPNFALLPAVAQIHIAMYFAKLNWNVAFEIEKMSKIKFSNMIRPKMAVELSLKLDNDAVSFKYSSADKVFSSGTLVFRK